MTSSQATIRSVLAGFLLAVFTLGATPRIMVHALAAHHKDTHLSADHSKTDRLNNAGFHCTVDNQVVESPFIITLADLEPALPMGFADKAPSQYKVHLSASHFIFGLRGPPAIV